MTSRDDFPGGADFLAREIMPCLASPSTTPRWDDLLDDFRHSGLTHAEFCRSRGLPLHTFRKRLYRDRTTGAATGPRRFTGKRTIKEIVARLPGPI